MARLASAADFENGPLYSDYRRYPYFLWRAQWLTQRYGTSGKWLIVGCGWGFLVDELLKLGVDCWGIDAASYCKTKATTELVATSSARVLQADATNRQQITSTKNAMGITGNNRIPFVVTEDVLTCFTDAEITIGLTELRRSATTLIHIVTAVPEGTDVAAEIAVGNRAAGLNWKTMTQWKALVGNDTVLNAEGHSDTNAEVL